MGVASSHDLVMLVLELFASCCVIKSALARIYSIGYPRFAVTERVVPENL